MEHLSHSGRMTYKSCQRSWFWSYEARIQPKLKPRGRSMGSAFSIGLETGGNQAVLDYYVGLIDRAQTQSEVDELINQREVVCALLDGYWQQYPYPMQREVEFNLEIPTTDVRNVGFIDGMTTIDGQAWLVEDKLLTPTFWGQGNINALALDEQTTAYLYANRALGLGAKGLLYRTTMKPGIKRRLSRSPESPQEFTKRLVDDVMSRPEHYFRQYDLYRSDDELDEFEQETIATVQSILSTREIDIWVKNTASCGAYGGCPFVPLCKGEPGAEGRFEERSR